MIDLELARKIIKVDYMQIGRLVQIRARGHDADNLVTVEIIREVEGSKIKYMMFGKLENFFNPDKTVDISHGFHYQVSEMGSRYRFYEFECNYYNRPFKGRLYSNPCDQTWDFIPILKGLVGKIKPDVCYRTNSAFDWEAIQLKRSAFEVKWGASKAVKSMSQPSLQKSTEGYFWDLGIGIPVTEQFTYEGSWESLT